MGHEFSKMYFLLNMGIFQQSPMLVYQRVFQIHSRKLHMFQFPKSTSPAFSTTSWIVRTVKGSPRCLLASGWDPRYLFHDFQRVPVFQGKCCRIKKHLKVVFGDDVGSKKGGGGRNKATNLPICKPYSSAIWKGGPTTLPSLPGIHSGAGQSHRGCDFKRLGIEQWQGELWWKSLVKKIYSLFLYNPPRYLNPGRCKIAATSREFPMVNTRKQHQATYIVCK